MKYLKRFNEDVTSTSEGTENYMFFGNLKAIKRMIDELLELDEQETDDIIKNGHDWAEDHIAVAKENIEQVYNFLINKEDVNTNEPETGSGLDKLGNTEIINEE